MIELKKYQRKTLDILSRFLKSALELDRTRAGRGAKLAFLDLVDGQYEDEELPGIPSICIRIPTGGGKTLVACHAISELLDEFLQYKCGRSLVLWFVPSDTIRTQTLANLQNRRHPYREVLDVQFDNSVSVLSNEEALHISREQLEQRLCIIVSTLSALRRDDPEGLRAYKENGELLEHFRDITDAGRTLEKDEGGETIHSLVNLIKIQNPIVVIDEGHHAKTPLSFDMLRLLNPCFILEYTATPRPESNVLVDISAYELKEEDMVKLPIKLLSLPRWQEAVREGVQKRNELEEITKEERDEYIRPISVFQAEQEKFHEGKVLVDTILNFLTDEMRIPRQEIAIKTSKRNELELHTPELGCELANERCPIRYIITINALAEGWDCPFAYVLVSASQIGSRISVEQIIGRILRLPHAARKPEEDLNCSYVFTSSRNFDEAANIVIAGLEKNGYSRADVVSLRRERPEEKIIFKKVNPRFDCKIPLISIREQTEDRRLEFYRDLIGSKLDSAQQDTSVDVVESEGRLSIIDVTEAGQITRKYEKTEETPSLSVNEQLTEEELINWLDRNIRRHALAQHEKRSYLERVIANLLLSGLSLPRLSTDRFVLKEAVGRKIDKIFSDFAKQTFGKLRTEGRLAASRVFFEFPSQVEIVNPATENFKRTLYERTHSMNREELEVARRLDNLDNIQWWHKNKERKDFFLQGWKPNRIYFDFAARSTNGTIIILEYKGEERLTTEDTEFKAAVGRTWHELNPQQCYFALVSKQDIDAVFDELRRL